MSILKWDELSIIFKYLNGVDLHNASQVCRFWLEIAIEENKRRNPTCIIKNGSIKCIKDWETFKTQFIDHCRTKPSLHLMFHNYEYEKKLLKGCYCQYLPYNCISITAENFDRFITENTISNIFFPEIPNIKITTITLNNQSWDEGVYCEELKCLFDKSFSNPDKLKTIFEPFTGNDIPMSSCVVFLYRDNNNKIASNLALCLKEWFPNKKMSILAITTNRLSICNTVYNSHICQHNADCIAILLKGTNMASWNHQLDFYSFVEEEMTEFKKKVSLKKHSVCFMTNNESVDYYDGEEIKLFQTSFPNVPIFKINCIESVVTHELREFNASFYSGYNMDEFPKFMLLTYD